MDILIAGNLEPLSEKFYEKLNGENKYVVCGKTSVGKFYLKNITPYDFDDSQLEELFSSFSFRTVIYISKAIDGTKKVFNELENIENILYLCKQYKTSNLIYITTNDLAGDESIDMEKEGSRYILLHSCERLCHNAAKTEKLDVTILRIPYLYSCSLEGNQMGKWIQSAVREKIIKLPGESRTITDFLCDKDLGILIERMIDEPHRGYLEMNLTGGNEMNFYELGNIIKEQEKDLTIRYLNYKTAIPKALNNGCAREEYGWFPKEDISNDIAAMIEEERGKIYKKKRKKFLQNRPKLRELLITILEFVVLFFTMLFLEAKSEGDPFLEFLDFRMMFVIILGATRGFRIGITASIFAGISYVIKSLDTTSWQIIFYNTQNWLPFAVYFLAGAISGYSREKSENTKRFYEEEKTLLEEKYIFLNELYHNTLENKEEYRQQIMSYKDSYGKIYTMIKKLASTIPEKIFLEAINVLEDILENQTIAIYATDGKNDFARLNVCSKTLNETLSKSLRLSSMEEIKKTLEQGEIWVNVNAIPDYPAYAEAIRWDGICRGIVMVYHASDKQMNQEYANKFSIVCGLIQEFLERAIAWEEKDEQERMLPDTRILKQSYFEQMLEVKRQMKEKSFGDYILAKINVKDIPLSELSMRLSSVLRQNDIIGQGKEDEIYIVLSQTKENNLAAIRNRMEEKGLSFEVISKY